MRRSLAAHRASGAAMALLGSTTMALALATPVTVTVPTGDSLLVQTAYLNQHDHARRCAETEVCEPVRPVISPGEPLHSQIRVTNHNGPDRAALYVAAAEPCQEPFAEQHRRRASTNVCTHITIQLRDHNHLVYSGPLAALGTTATITTRLNRGKSTTYDMTMTLDEGLENQYQGVTITAPITWTLTQTA